MDNISKITFKQFIQSYNFREAVPSRYNKTSDRRNTQIIRIYVDELCDSGGLSYWFEFGVNDWGNEKDTIVNRVLNDQIRNSFVDSISYSTDDDVLCIYLTCEPQEPVYDTEDNSGDNITFAE